MAKKRTDGDEDAADGARSFSVFVAKIDGGDLAAELAREQMKLMKVLGEHAERHQKAKGSITVTFNYAAEDSGLVMVKGDVKVKEPKKIRPSSVFFMMADGNLSEQNQKQTTLFGDKGLRAVDGYAGKPREVVVEAASPREAAADIIKNEGGTGA